MLLTTLNTIQMESVVKFSYFVSFLSLLMIVVNICFIKSLIKELKEETKMFSKISKSIFLTLIVSSCIVLFIISVKCIFI